MKRLFRVLIPSLAAAVAGAFLVLAVRAAGSSAGQPGSWAGWHHPERRAAGRAQALPPGHPPISGEWADALPPGHPPIGEEWADALPPGHPPIGGDWAGTLPPGHPPLGGPRTLPPGHPPLDEAFPFGGPDAGSIRPPARPLPFTFDRPQTTTL